MTADEIKQLHTFLLLTLQGAGALGAVEFGVLAQARLHGFRDLTEPQLGVQLRTLADCKLVLSYQPALGGQRWKITGLGTAALQEAGLA